ncbi:MAG: cytochrome c biosis protein CcmG, thiol:disulfide interchange protein DsbE [Gaiellales bacterium]|jgi:peroxiredoxin|nr:cytochrome c biosis protein CcmG, thiol:disulfide interchange protein DsbE [Gaiellales bacterium]
MLSVALLTAGLVVILAVVAFGRSHSGALKPPPMQLTKPGDRTPAVAFDATTIAGRKVSLAGFHGKPLVINFFAAWCEPCKREAPAFTRLEQRYQGRVSLLSVAVLTSHRSNLDAFVHDHGITWPVIWDQGGNLTDSYGILGTPVTYVIDGQGRVVYRIIGPTSEHRMAGLLDQLLPA